MMMMSSQRFDHGCLCTLHLLFGRRRGLLNETLLMSVALGSVNGAISECFMLKRLLRMTSCA